MIWNYLNERMKMYNKSWIVDTEQRYQYSEVIETVLKFGMTLKKKLKKKTKCAILCKNNYNTAVALLSCWYADLIPIPMSLNYGQAHCDKIIKGTMPTVLITDERITASSYQVCVFDMNTNEFLDEIVQQDEEELLDDITLIMNTSGTTGNPKGAMITEEGLIQNVLAIADYFDINNEDTILIARPLYHCAVLTGEFLVSLYKGLNINFINDTYNPISMIQYLEKEKITVLCGTPTLFQHMSMLCRRMGKSNLVRVIAISGECLTQEVAAQIREVFSNTDIYNVYGLTEASPRISYLDPKLFDSMPESVGVAIKNTLIKICDDDGNELSANMHGNVYVYSPSIMKGYYGNKSLTQEKIINGWMITGDIGYKDADGFLYIMSRADDMIIKAGMNIYPREIENVLIKLPIVNEIVAYGIKEKCGQGIAVDIVLSEKYKDITKKVLYELFSRELPSYLLPSQINIVDKLKKNASGKIIRARL